MADTGDGKGGERNPMVQRVKTKNSLNRPLQESNHTHVSWEWNLFWTDQSEKIKMSNVSIKNVLHTSAWKYKNKMLKLAVNSHETDWKIYL